MLETIRAYATQRYAAEREAVRARHYRYYLALAQRHGTERALWGTSRKEHVARLDADVDNLHAALGRAVGQDSAEPALAMCAALARYWIMRDRNADAVDWIDQALSVPRADAHPELRVRALCVKAWALWPLGRIGEQPAVVEEAETLARALADPVLLWLVLHMRSTFEGTDGRLDKAEALADEALRWASTAGDSWAIAMAAFPKAMAAASAAELRVRVDRAATLLHETGNVYLLAELLAAAAFAALCRGSDRDASEFVARATPHRARPRQSLHVDAPAGQRRANRAPDR
jgi:hypothetical protein